MIEARKLDIVLVKKETVECLVLDIAVPVDAWIEGKMKKQTSMEICVDEMDMIIIDSSYRYIVTLPIMDHQFYGKVVL